MTQTITSLFSIADPVFVDQCKDLTGVITAITWRHPSIISYEVSWVANGKSESAFIEGWRLTPASR